MNNTKIICTIGPACCDKENILSMIKSGMDVARLNMSHADYEFCEQIIKIIRQLNKELRTNIAVLIDTKGYEVRLLNIENDEIILETGKSIAIVKENITGTIQSISTTYDELVYDLEIGNRILINNGMVELEVIAKKGDALECKIINGGIIKTNSSVRFPGINLNRDFLSAYDKETIEFANRVDADYLALSFVRKYTDILDINDLLISLNNEHMQIIAKIENSSAINDIDNIINTCDGIMIARGDLGQDIELEKVPHVQKEIIKKVRQTDKFSIVATELLASMEEKNKPTRAEVSDVANAIIDGCDAVMLSGETAIGKYPIDAVKEMKKIITATEENLDCTSYANQLISYSKEDITGALASGVVDCANRVDAKAIVVSTLSGYTAVKVSKFRPNCPIVVTTPEQKVALSLSLNWGIKTLVTPIVKNTDDIIYNARQVAKYMVGLETGDKIIITGGIPLQEVKYTNFMKVEEIK